MKMNLYPKLAWHGISKNKKTYLPFLLTSIGIVMMYYIVSYLTYNKSVYAMPGGSQMQMILSWGTVVIAVFAVIFLFYMNSFLMRRRKTEFGLYNILGMGKWNIARILLWQTMMLLVASLIGGLGAGILFSKLAELLATKMLGQEAVLTFTIEPISIRKTVILTIAAFALILFYSLGQIHLSKPIELLRGEKVGERPPKARWILAAIGFILLGIAYYLAVTTTEPMAALTILFVAVILVIISTYLLFICGAVALCKILQKNKRYYYQTSHFVSVSSMAYRMKRNGASLASICILSTAVLVMISSSLCLFIGAEDMLHNRYPRDLMITTYSNEDTYTNTVDEVMQEVLQSHDLTPQEEFRYQTLSISGMLDKNRLSLELDGVGAYIDYNNLLAIAFFTLDEYEALSGKSETLSDNEVLMYMYRGDYNYDTIQIGDMKPFQIKKEVDNFVDIEDSMASIVSSMYVVVPDTETMQEIYDYQKQIYAENASEFQTLYGCNLECDDEIQTEIVQQLQEKIADIQNENTDFPRVAFDSYAQHRADYYALYGGLLFLGILLSIVFLFGTVLIMYYKQISEGYEDASRFEIMQKVGMTQKEIRKSINSQVLTVFAAPLLAAGIHTAFAFPLVRRLLVLFGLTNTSLFIGVTAGCFLVFALLYVLMYRLTSRSYYQLVK